jgi:hypothetical protein
VTWTSTTSARTVTRSWTSSAFAAPERQLVPAPTCRRSDTVSVTPWDEPSALNCPASRIRNRSQTAVCLLARCPSGAIRIAADTGTRLAPPRADCRTKRRRD